LNIYNKEIKDDFDFIFSLMDEDPIASFEFSQDSAENLFLLLLLSIALGMRSASRMVHGIKLMEKNSIRKKYFTAIA